MKKVLVPFALIIMLACFAMLAYTGWIFASETYKFWKHGEENRAEVLSLEKTTRSRRGGSTYYHRLKILDYEVVAPFSNLMSVGDGLEVLTLPDDMDKVSLGNSDSSIFELFAFRIGSDGMAFTILGIYLYSLILIPYQIVKNLKVWTSGNANDVDAQNVKTISRETIFDLTQDGLLVLRKARMGRFIAWITGGAIVLFVWNLRSQSPKI